MTEYWEPHTEADIEAAIEQRLVREAHHFDFKAQPPPPLKNDDIAVDFASFAVDGGRLLYGVKQRTSTDLPTLAPFDVSGLPERLDQIARGGTIEPPVRIRCQDIPSDHQPGKAYLLVVVPRSATAPHMVDRRYRGRSDTTNTILSDAEVRRLIAERTERQADIQALLEEEVARDPTGPNLRTQGHLFVVAQPLFARADLLSRALGTHDWRNWLQGTFRQVVAGISSETRGAPDLFQEATTLSARVAGWAVCTYEMGEDRHIRANGTHAATEDDLLDLEVQDDGGLRLFCSRASFDWDARGGRYLFSDLIVRLTRRVIRAALAVSQKAAFEGEWGFGLALRGVGTALVEVDRMGGSRRRTLDPYDEVATATYDELHVAPDDIARRLLGRLFRGLGFLDYVPGLPAE